MKAFTDISQSKKLAEFLPIESADMYWKNGVSDKFIQCFTPFVIDEYRSNVDYDYDIPCWSLAALLQVLPLGIYDEFDNCDYELEIDMIDKMPRYIRLGDIYHSKFPYDFEKDTLLDNVVESIIWLNDNNYFEL